MANVLTVAVMGLEYYRIVKGYQKLEKFLRKYSELLFFSFPLLLFIPLMCMSNPVVPNPAYCEGNPGGSIEMTTAIFLLGAC
jgi:hypothetical protein